MAHGSDAVVELIEESGWSYPVSVHRLERAHGLENVRLDARGRHFTTVLELLSRGDVDRFDDESDLRECVDSLVEAELASRRTGLVVKVKGFFGLQ